MITLNKFRYLTVSGVQYEEWLEEVPSVAPDGAAVSGSTLTITDTLSENTVKAEIIEEKWGQTGEHFQATCLVVESSGIGWQEQDISWPYPVSMLSAQFNISEEHIGDIIEAQGGGDGVLVGTLNTYTASGSDTLTISGIPLDKSELGIYVKLLQYGSGLDHDCGRVISRDTETEEITIENEVPQDITPSQGDPVLFKIYAKFVTNFHMVTAGRHTIGDTKIGSSYIPVGVPLRLRYYNSDGAAKKFGVMLEYLY